MEHLRDGLLLGCGNPLLDISAVVEPSFLEKYGMKPDDAILAATEHMPLYQELIHKYKAEYIAGGSVQNSLRVCQWLVGRPNTAVFFGCVGQDDYSKILEEKARSNGLNVIYQYTNEAPTGTCGVLITGTHRSLCANLAAAELFTIDHLNKDDNEKLIQNASYFYISGFFLTVSLPSIEKISKFSYENNRTFLMNLSAPFISQAFIGPLLDVFPYIDILFGNEAEAETFASVQGWGTKDVREIGKKMLELPKQNQAKPRIVIITQGSSPVLLIQKDSIEEFPVEKLSNDQVVDTNGAGDAFVGGFLSQFIQQKSLACAINCGIWAARQIIQRSGCTFDGEATFTPPCQ